MFWQVVYSDVYFSEGRRFHHPSIFSGVEPDPNYYFLPLLPATRQGCFNLVLRPDCGTMLSVFQDFLLGEPHKSRLVQETPYPASVVAGDGSYFVPRQGLNKGSHD